MSENTNSNGENHREPAYIAYDATLWANDQEHVSLGVSFSHRDRNGLDVLPLAGTLILRTPGSSPAAVEAIARRTHQIEAELPHSQHGPPLP